jgi:hypothetical protein
MTKPTEDGYYGFKPDGISNEEPAQVWVGYGVARYRLFGYSEDDWSFVDQTEDWQWSDLRFEPIVKEIKEDKCVVSYSTWLSTKTEVKYYKEGALYSGLTKNCPEELKCFVSNTSGKFVTIWKETT